THPKPKLTIHVSKEGESPYLSVNIRSRAVPHSKEGEPVVTTTRRCGNLNGARRSPALNAVKRPTFTTNQNGDPMRTAATHSAGKLPAQPPVRNPNRIGVSTAGNNVIIAARNARK